MDAELFAKMMSDSSITDLKKLGYKYPQADLKEFIRLLRESFFCSLPLRDFHGQPLVYLEGVAQVRLSAVKTLMTSRDGVTPYGIKAMEEEILSTFSIEQIYTSRDSVRKILAGYAPADENERHIYGMKRGLDFISDPCDRISEENIHQLYELTMGEVLPQGDKLLPQHYYRHDSVYVVGEHVEHTGLPWKKLPEYMAEFVSFIGENSGMNDLLKAAAIHFYLAFLHPYFDGNGRMARLLHLWYLVQQGYPSALFVPLSEYIDKSRRAYYNAYTLVEQNARISGTLDITPFLLYFIENVYHKLETRLPDSHTIEEFQAVLAEGKVTEKERNLWNFVLSSYGDSPFSTKQLERDFGNAAYATVRGFVLKLERLGLLSSQKYGNRVKYRIRR